jgi:hypothetical protein
MCEIGNNVRQSCVNKLRKHQQSIKVMWSNEIYQSGERNLGSNASQNNKIYGDKCLERANAVKRH